MWVCPLVQSNEYRVQFSMREMSWVMSVWCFLFFVRGSTYNSDFNLLVMQLCEKVPVEVYLLKNCTYLDNFLIIWKIHYFRTTFTGIMYVEPGQSHGGVQMKKIFKHGITILWKNLWLFFHSHAWFLSLVGEQCITKSNIRVDKYIARLLTGKHVTLLMSIHYVREIESQVSVSKFMKIYLLLKITLRGIAILLCNPT